MPKEETCNAINYKIKSLKSQNKLHDGKELINIKITKIKNYILKYILI